MTPRCETVAFVERIERVPLGYFRDAILLGCVDSRAARQSINRMAWRVARAWIDAGIDPVAGRARVVTYLCENARPCLECAWDDEDYEAVEQEYPCTVAEAAAGSWPYDPNRATRDPDPGCTDAPSDRSEPRYGAARETRREKGEEPQARRNEGHE